VERRTFGGKTVIEIKGKAQTALGRKEKTAIGKGGFKGQQ